MEHGKKLGRTLGFPTFNVEWPEGKLVPPWGVYISGVKQTAYNVPDKILRFDPAKFPGKGTVYQRCDLPVKISASLLGRHKFSVCQWQEEKEEYHILKMFYVSE